MSTKKLQMEKKACVLIFPEELVSMIALTRDLEVTKQENYQFNDVFGCFEDFRLQLLQSLILLAMPKD